VRGERAYKEVWGGAPSGVQGQSPLWGQGTKPTEAESFLYTFIQKRDRKLKI